MMSQDKNTAFPVKTAIAAALALAALPTWSQESLVLEEVVVTAQKRTGVPSPSSSWSPRRVTQPCWPATGSLRERRSSSDAGSAAGVAAMGIEKIHFGWYARKIGPLAALGFFAGVGVYLLEHSLR